MQNEIITELRKQGAKFVYFVDISELPQEQHRGYRTAIVFGIILSPGFIEKVSNTPDYVAELVKNNQVHEDEFHNAEIETDRLADFIANYIISKGYDAFSQSEKSLDVAGYYNQQTHQTLLPHKTLARLAGLGWIGKHNLMVNPIYGSAISMCTVLTNAPVKTEQYEIMESQCGNCNVCADVCPEQVIYGKAWSTQVPRDEIVNVYSCTTCARCLALCPWTQKYMKQSIANNN